MSFFPSKKTVSMGGHSRSSSDDGVEYYDQWPATAAGAAITSGTAVGDAVASPATAAAASASCAASAAAVVAQGNVATFIPYCSQCGFQILPTTAYNDDYNDNYNSEDCDYDDNETALSNSAPAGLNYLGNNSGAGSINGDDDDDDDDRKPAAKTAENLGLDQKSAVPFFMPASRGPICKICLQSKANAAAAATTAANSNSNMDMTTLQHLNEEKKWDEYVSRGDGVAWSSSSACSSWKKNNMNAHDRMNAPPGPTDPFHPYPHTTSSSYSRVVAASTKWLEDDDDDDDDYDDEPPLLEPFEYRHQEDMFRNLQSEEDASYALAVALAEEEQEMDRAYQQKQQQQLLHHPRNQNKQQNPSEWELPEEWEVRQQMWLQHEDGRGGVIVPTTCTKVSDVECYIGQYNVHGERHDTHGELHYRNGDWYHGGFVHGMRHGKGLLHYHDGSEDKGDWYRDQMHGFGRRKYLNGDVYVGQFRNGQRCTTRTAVSSSSSSTTMAMSVADPMLSKLRFACGDLYVGDWKADQFHGHGRYFFTDGTAVEGNWVMGVKAGKFKLQHHPSMDLDILRYENDVMVGKGARWNANRTKTWLLKAPKPMTLEVESAISGGDVVSDTTMPPTKSTNHRRRSSDPGRTDQEDNPYGPDAVGPNKAYRRSHTEPSTLPLSSTAANKSDDAQQQQQQQLQLPHAPIKAPKRGSRIPIAQAVSIGYDCELGRVDNPVFWHSLAQDGDGQNGGGIRPPDGIMMVVPTNTTGGSNNRGHVSSASSSSSAPTTPTGGRSRRSRFRRMKNGSNNTSPNNVNINGGGGSGGRLKPPPPPFPPASSSSSCMPPPPLT